MSLTSSFLAAGRNPSRTKDPSCINSLLGPTTANALTERGSGSWILTKFNRGFHWHKLQSLYHFSLGAFWVSIHDEAQSLELMKNGEERWWWAGNRAGRVWHNPSGWTGRENDRAAVRLTAPSDLLQPSSSSWPGHSLVTCIPVYGMEPRMCCA